MAKDSPGSTDREDARGRGRRGHVPGIIDGTYFRLYRALGDNRIELHSPRHEAAAMHMASLRPAHRPGSVAMASNGPGVANAAGVAVEEGEGNRILLITSSRRVPIAYPTGAARISTSTRSA